jgi:hypothetical protein
VRAHTHTHTRTGVAWNKPKEHEMHQYYNTVHLGTQFTRFTGTKVQILTQKVLLLGETKLSVSEATQVMRSLFPQWPGGE